MEVSDIVSLISNVGFPVTLCFILIRHVLQTIEEKLDRLDMSIKQLAQAIESFKDEKSKGKL
ncbi:YvrJ protein family protein [compost metagenome]